jgi:hypothetical protein
LIRIDPATALVTDIGSFGFTGTTLADIKFDPTTGILYGLRSGGFGTPSDHWLYKVSLTTGAAIKVERVLIRFRAERGSLRLP